MVVVPALLPLTTPEVFTEAIAELLLLHTPPVVVSPRLVVEPTQTFRLPVKAAGVGFTVTTAALFTVHPGETADTV